jgi:tetratricopeptide (TPR) repeat protein
MTEAASAFAQACDDDRHGREAEAIAKYQRALALGLPAEQRREARVGLGSSLRNVGRHLEALEVLRDGLREHPHDAALTSFLALALSSAGRSDEGVAMLLELVCAHAPVGAYARALRLYAGELTSSEKA